MVQLETPSRIWRRIEAVEGKEMPSLPSLPAFDESDESQDQSNSLQVLGGDLLHLSSQAPVHSTPATASSSAGNVHPSSSTGSTARFATSIASRSTKSISSASLATSGKGTSLHSFDVSAIPSLPTMYYDGKTVEANKVGSLTDANIPPDTDAESDGYGDNFRRTEGSSFITRDQTSSDYQLEDKTGQQKRYDYSISLRSEPKPSPVNKFRNVSFRRPLARARTPDLSHELPSSDSSSANSTPHSSQSVSIPPAVVLQRPKDGSNSTQEILTSEDPACSFQRSHEHSGNFLDNADRERSSSETSQIVQAPKKNDSKCESRGQTQKDQQPTLTDPGSTTTSPSPVGTGYRQASATSASPAPSSVFTPTPAFQTRPLARFNVPMSLQTPLQRQPGLSEDEFTTPFTRRRSFLLSVINSEARPRPKFATPHPRRNGHRDNTDEQSTLGVNMLTTFAGATPRPVKRSRPSHPLAQTFVAPPDTPGATSPAAQIQGTGPARVLPRWSLSPSEDDRASFISTASSHDLTSRHRMNTSFDPIMGLGAQGHGVGRFNAGKLNTYLHGLNRRLQDENEELMRKLSQLEGTSEIVGKSSSVPGSRRVSLAGIALGDVKEDIHGEGWMEEKAELEKMVDDFRMELQTCIAEREAVENILEEERRERARDKERWKERMAEVEKGVEGIIADLECRIADAEKHTKDVEAERDVLVKGLRKKVVELQEERDVALEKVQRAEQSLDNGRELGGELKDANQRIDKLMADLRNANVQIKELEEDALKSDERVEQVETELENGKRLRRSLEDERRGRSEELLKLRNDLKDMEEKLKNAEAASREARLYAEAVEDDAGLAVDRIQDLEGQLTEMQSKIQILTTSDIQANERIRKLDAEIQRSAELNRQMEEALEAAEQKMSTDDEQIANLRAQISSMQRQREQDLRDLKNSSSPTRQAGPSEEDLEELEDELENANREIGRLNMLLHQSPARKAIEKAKDTKIEMLEKERDDLLERIQALKTTMADIATPNKLNTSTMSPMHRHLLSISVRTPKTPGGPLRDMSWLNKTSNDPTLVPLLAEIARLQRELDHANESIDDKLDRLGEAGLGVVNLTKKLDDARSRIAALEENIARLSRREDRRIRRLERARCQKCHGRVDLRGLHRAAEGDESSIDISRTTIPPDPPTPPTRTSEALRADLQSAIVQLDRLKKKWTDEKRRLLGQNAALQDAANRLNAEVLNVKDEMKRVVEKQKDSVQKKAGIQGELERARGTIVELENGLKAERARLRAFTTEQEQMQKDKKGVMLQLQRTESDMEDVKGQLHHLKREKTHLEQQLEEHAIVDQKARMLEGKVAENTKNIEQLRQERSLLSKDHKDLRRRFTEISEQANRLRDELMASQTAHDDRRQQLDLYVLEIEDLRRALSDQGEELQRTEAEKKRIAAEKGDVARIVAVLEADLERVRKDAKAFGQDLKMLRTEKEKLEAKHKGERAKLVRARKDCESQIRRLNEQLVAEQEKTNRAEADLQQHVCVINEKDLSAIKLQHNKECKGLMVQIRYLKAKYTRESGFRCALGYQKEYLLTLLSICEKSEQTIIAALARIGFPTRPPAAARRGRSLKSVALSVVFIVRAKRVSELWKERCTIKEELAAALEEVRHRRVTHS